MWPFWCSGQMGLYWVLFRLFFWLQEKEKQTWSLQEKEISKQERFCWYRVANIMSGQRDLVSLMTFSNIRGCSDLCPSVGRLWIIMTAVVTSMYNPTRVAAVFCLLGDGHWTLTYTVLWRRRSVRTFVESVSVWDEEFAASHTERQGIRYQQW